MPDIQTITELVENDTVFKCNGYAVVKITVREYDGKPTSKRKAIQIPIRAAGVEEYKNELAKKAPQPPVKHELVKATSDKGKALGLSKDSEIVIFDTTDEAYIDALTKHNQDFLWRVAIFAIDLVWKTADGGVAESYEDKKRILQHSGITGPQLDQIYQDVVALSRFVEDRQDFLYGN